jgi:membrane protease YdiL (CAAX protease family)
MMDFLINFANHPATKSGPKALRLTDFLYLLLLDLIITGVLMLFLSLLGLDKSAFLRLDMEEIKENLVFFMAAGILVVVPLEEFLFRYYLNYNTKNLWISAILLFLFFIISFDASDPLGSSICFLSAAFVITMLILKQLFGFTSPKILIWGSIVSFGLFHITNYEPAAYSSNYLIIPLLVLPQLIGGFFLAFIRTHYRFVDGILFHAAFNLVVITLGILTE